VLFPHVVDQLVEGNDLIGPHAASKVRWPTVTGVPLWLTSNGDAKVEFSSHEPPFNADPAE
jgi:hypothetical protein